MKEDQITVKEVLNMPGNSAQVELVNGKIISRAKTTTNHQLIVGELMQIIYRHLKLQETYGEVLTFVPTILDDYDMFLPDLLVVSDKEKIDNDTGCVGVPDWIIEVADPESRKMDYFIKTETYMRAGVKEYWSVDYEKQKVLVHNFLEYDTSIFSFQNTIKGRAINEVAIDFKEISNCLLRDQEENKKYNVRLWWDEEEKVWFADCVELHLILEAEELSFLIDRLWAVGNTITDLDKLPRITGLTIDYENSSLPNMTYDEAE